MIGKMEWISSRGGIGVPSHKSWESWWDEEQEHLQHTGFRSRVLTDEKWWVSTLARIDFFLIIFSFCLWDWLTNEIDQVQTQACHSEEFILSRVFQHLSTNSPPHSVHREI